MRVYIYFYISTMVFETILTAILFLKLCFLYIFGNIAVRTPCLTGFIVKQMNRVASIVMPINDYWDSLFTWPMILTLWKYGRYEIHKSSLVGKATPNPRLISALTDPEKRVSVDDRLHLLDLVHGSRPLVVVFGSCTCPVVIAKMANIHEAQREFADVADFAFVYVQEAHPEDGWRMKNNYKIERHDSTEQRIEASQNLRSLLDKDIPLYADTIENEASIAYSALPNRILIIQGDVLAYQNGPGPTSFDFDGVRSNLQKFRQSV